MAQEFTLKSEAIENKINQLLPTQGGFQPGVDFSASTMVVPIVDLTETAEGSSLRQDLQRASSINTTFSTAINQTTVVANTPGYYLLQITYVLQTLTVTNTVSVDVTDGTSTANVFKVMATSSSAQALNTGNKELMVKISAGEQINIVSANTSCRITCSSNQIADISGNLTNL